METKVISSIRGKPMLVVDSFKYNFNKDIKSSGEKFWKCINRQCKSTVHTLGSLDSVVVTKHNVQHSHDANEKRLNRQILSESCKRKATEDLAEKPAKIIRQELQKSVPSSLTTTDMEYVRHTVYNARRRVLPCLPKNASEVHKILSAINIVTSKDENFIFINSESDNIVVFSCTTNIRVLSSVSRLYMDGTFNYCTRYFCQLFTIHGYVNEHYIPLLFCLLPNKSTETYKKLFTLVISTCLTHKLSLSINEIVVDFEKAIHLAAVDVWPNVQIIGCRFHLAQSWYRKIQNCGLVTEYKTETSEIGRWLRLTFALMYLDPKEVGDCFALELSEHMPQDGRLVQFADYLVDYYISEESVFPPVIWAEQSATLSRTTNACESFHSNFNSSMYKEHPNLFVFIEKLKEFQLDTYIKIQSLHIPRKIHDKKFKKRQQFIHSLIIKYQNGQLNRVNFLKCLSFHCSALHSF